MSNECLEIVGLKKIFDNEVIFQDVTFQLYPGEILSVLGSSGAGKTTLLKILAGLITDFQGEIIYKGMKVTNPTKNILYVPQSFDQLLPWKTAVGNIMLVFQLARKMSRKEARQESYRLLEDLGLSQIARKYPYQLSGGQKQRVAFARAVAAHAEIILLDEPFSSLDLHIRNQMQNVIKNTVKDGSISVIFVTHNLEEALTLSDNILVLRCGEECTIIKKEEMDLSKLLEELSL